MREDKATRLAHGRAPLGERLRFTKESPFPASRHFALSETETEIRKRARKGPECLSLSEWDFWVSIDEIGALLKLTQFGRSANPWLIFDPYRF